MIHLILQHILWFFIKLLFSTLKVEFKNKKDFVAARGHHPDRVFIFAVWHENVVSTLRAHAWSEPLLTLSSRSKDGDYANFVAQKLGFIGVRGSSKKGKRDKGGKEAVNKYISMFKEGYSGGITVDGPRGPRQVCKPGVAFIAQQTGAPIIPVCGKASSYWEFNSWDRFKIPKPFATITVSYGAPIIVPPEATTEEVEKICAVVTERLKKLS